MKYYTLDMLEEYYRRENPNLLEGEIKEKAKQLHRQLNTLENPLETWQPAILS